MAKITDYTGAVLGTTQQRASIFLRMLCEDIVTTSRPNTPRDKGNLNQDVLKTVSGLKGRIEWRKVYAEYQERGKRRDGSRVVKNYTTPGTGPHFAENAVKLIAEKAGAVARRANLV